MNRSEAEADVRAIARTCRGPINAEAAGVRDALLTDDRLEEAAAEDKAGRPGCGYDVNDIICSVPFDAQPRQATCPKCGVTIAFTPPIYESGE